jgi:hypothetical protein
MSYGSFRSNGKNRPDFLSLFAFSVGSGMAILLSPKFGDAFDCLSLSLSRARSILLRTPGLSATAGTPDGAKLSSRVLWGRSRVLWIVWISTSPLLSLSTHTHTHTHSLAIARSA